MVRSVNCDVLSSRRPSVLTFWSVKTAEAQGMIRLRKCIFQNYLVIKVTVEADSAASSIFPWPSTLHGPHNIIVDGLATINTRKSGVKSV